MITADYDLRFLQAGLDQLEDYLLSKEIYWPIGIQALSGQPPYPQLTLGWLLLIRTRAESTGRSASEQAEVERLNSALHAIRLHWRAAWSKKVQGEFRSRLNLWRDFLDEYRGHPAANADRFTYEVNRRVLLELLKDEAEQLSPADIQALSGLDLRLRSMFQPGGFVWDPSWISAFPESKFWFLYGSLR